jgi:hypothetical protein
VANGAIKCAEVKCAKDEYVLVTGACKTKDGDAARNGNDCGADNHRPCNTKASCEASAASPAYWTKSNAKCTACAAGKFRNAGDSLSLQASTACAAAHHDATAHKALDLCKEGFHVVNHACVECATGYTNVAGDDPNLPINTACTPTVTPKRRGNCNANEHVVNHACVACLPGTTNEAGDDHGGHDTVCIPTKCKANEHVVSHKCVPCNPDKKGAADNHISGHLTNTAGDDASGPNTECYAL